MTDEHLLSLVDDAYDVGPEEIPERVRQLARTAGFAALQASLATRPALRIDRRLAPAAASGGRVLTGAFESVDGRFRTTMFESADAHLVITVESETPFDGLVKVSWACVGDAGVADPRSLVTPLAKTRNGWAAEYDVGSVEGCDAVDVVPAEEIDQHLVLETDVETAFSVAQHGSAGRAWREALNEGRLEARLAAVAASGR